MVLEGIRARTVGGVRGATWMLVAAAVIVGLAIALGGAAARVLNGIGGVLWLVAAALMVSALRDAPRRWPGYGLAAAVTLVLVLAVKPNDVALALGGFVAGGALIALLRRDDGAIWARLVPAIWLPMHIGVAVVRATWRAATGGTAHVRTQPPPTAAIVPLVMVVAAWLGGQAVGWAIRRRHASAGRAPAGVGGD